MRRLLSIALTTLVLSAGTASAADGPAPPGVKNIVIVPGAFVDGSGWRVVHDILIHKGYTVSVVQPRVETLANDIEQTREQIRKQDGPVVLVGHSYGGAIITQADGHLFFDQAKFGTDFAGDLTKNRTDFMAVSQVPATTAAFGATMQVAAWHNKPVWGVVATDDHALSPDLERWMYKRANAKVTEIKASHVVYISQPEAVAKVIEDAARSVH